MGQYSVKRLTENKTDLEFLISAWQKILLVCIPRHPQAADPDRFKSGTRDMVIVCVLRSSL
jgi:hypothetical protein